MYRVLIADDEYEDRELLKEEITRALSGSGANIKFLEAASVRQALEILKTRPFDLLTLDIEFDRLNEGLEALPDIFEEYPTLNIVVISGKLNKAEVSERLFSFTKDNVLKSKRWARHFDVLDKKDSKDEALQRAFEFAIGQKDSADKIKELFGMAEGFMEQGEVDKCLDVYEKIQALAPGEGESSENIGILRGDKAFGQAQSYFRKGEKVVAALLLGHYLETRLKGFTRRALRRNPPGLYDCLKELEKAHRISSYKRDMFKQILKIRNRSIHHPGTIKESDFDEVLEKIKLLEAKI